MYDETWFSVKDVEAIQNIDGVEVATRYLCVNVGIQDTKKSIALNVSENYSVSTMLVIDGEAYDESSDGIWLSDRFAQENGIAIGDVLTATYRGLKIGAEVVGLIKSGENMICVADENQLMGEGSTLR